MGGGSYSQDVAREARSSGGDAFAYSTYTTSDDSGASQRKVHPALDPFETVREVNNATPIVVALDVTRSRGDDTKRMYEKLPMLMGEIELKGYVEGPGISFAAIGDATVDRAPLQVGQFEADNRLDEMLARMWIEEGGGGTGQESYELAAYYYARTNAVLLTEGAGHKGYFFFVGDEGFYPKVDRMQVRKIIGDDLAEDLDSAEVFRRLHEKFDVFFVYPEKSFEQRKADIDAEIRQRVTAAGGLYEGVDVRASLIWNNRNDLDLHVIPPSGEEIFYGHKRSKCGGWLDVDMNVQGETTKPVENIRWARGHAPKGRYKVFVQNYAFKEPKHTPTDFKVEIEIDGEVKHFEGTVSPNGETSGRSNVVVYEFDYDPDAAAEKPEDDSADDQYAHYSDEVILSQWASVIPKERILRIADPRAIVDVVLGALAISEGKSDHDAYAEDMRRRGHQDERIRQVQNALAGLTARATIGTAAGSIPPSGTGGRKRGGRTKRL